MVVCFYGSFFWHCSGLMELALPAVGLAVSGQEVPGARSLDTHTEHRQPLPSYRPTLTRKVQKRQ